MSSSEPGWVTPLREAVSGAARPGVEVVRGTRPGLLASDAVNALTSLLIAALVIAAATLRSGLAREGFDLIALLLRSAAVAFTLRALIALGLWVRRALRDGRAHEHALAWSEHGLLLQTPDGQRQLARADVLSLVIVEEPAVRGVSVSLSTLYVVARDACWQLPPYFASHPEILRARLARWLGTHAPPEHELPLPTEPAEARYTRIARGEVHAGERVVPEGFGYRLRAPYGVLLALVFVADALLHAGPQRALLLPGAGLALLLAPGALLLWFAFLRRKRKLRLGMAMVLAPEELLVRGKHGAVSLPWTQLDAVEVVQRQAWSPFLGRYLIRTLWFSARDGSHMRFDAAFLGWPAEVVAALAEAYRSGLATQGSGGGGGISGTDGATTSARSAT